MDSDVEMNAASDEEVMDDEDYYDYCYSDAGDDGSGGGDSEGELVAGDYDEGLEAEGTDEVVSRREQVRRCSGGMDMDRAAQCLGWPGSAGTRGVRGRMCLNRLENRRARVKCSGFFSCWVGDSPVS